MGSPELDTAFPTTRQEKQESWCSAPNSAAPSRGKGPILQKRSWKAPGLASATISFRCDHPIGGLWKRRNAFPFPGLLQDSLFQS